MAGLKALRRDSSFKSTFPKPIKNTDCESHSFPSVLLTFRACGGKVLTPSIALRDLPFRFRKKHNSILLEPKNLQNETTSPPQGLPSLSAISGVPRESESKPSPVIRFLFRERFNQAQLKSPSTIRLFVVPLMLLLLFLSSITIFYRRLRSDGQGSCSRPSPPPSASATSNCAYSIFYSYSLLLSSAVESLNHPSAFSRRPFPA